MDRGRVFILFVCLSVTCVVSGCASGGKKNVAPLGEGPDPEEQLRTLFAQEIAAGREHQGEGSARMLFSKPVYYKEYWEYPPKESVFSADFTEKESLSIPLTAETEVEKVRFATRTHRDKGEARTDENYLRSTGIEQVSYELRNGEWRRIGSLFLADKTEELRDGEWKQVEERKQVVILDEEEPRGFWSRLKFWK